MFPVLPLLIMAAAVGLDRLLPPSSEQFQQEEVISEESSPAVAIKGEGERKEKEKEKEKGKVSDITGVLPLPITPRISSVTVTWLRFADVVIWCVHKNSI